MEPNYAAICADIPFCAVLLLASLLVTHCTSFSVWEGLVVLEALGQVEEREREGMMVAAE